MPAEIGRPGQGAAKDPNTGRSRTPKSTDSTAKKKWYTAVRDDILDDDRLTLHDLAVYIALSRRMDKHGIAELTVLALSRQARVSPRKIYEALKRLESFGLVTRNQQHGAFGGQRQTRYWVRQRVPRPPKFAPQDSAPAPDAPPTSRDPAIQPLHLVQPHISAPAPDAGTAPCAPLKKRSASRVTEGGQP